MADKKGVSRFVLNVIFICELQVLMFGFTNCFVLKTKHVHYNNIMKNHDLQQLDLGEQYRFKESENHGDCDDTPYISGKEIGESSLKPDETDEAAIFKVMGELNDEEDAGDNETDIPIEQERGYPQEQGTIKDTSIRKIHEGTTIFEKMGFPTKTQTSGVKWKFNVAEDENKADDAVSYDSSLMVPNDDEDANEAYAWVAKSLKPFDAIRKCPNDQILVNGECISEFNYSLGN